jgi:putative transposase
MQKLNYIHENPVRAGMVWEPQHYRYSSAMDYYQQKTGMLPLVIFSK